MALPKSNTPKRCSRKCKQCRPWSDCSSWSSLIWVCTVCPDLSVRKLRIITVDQTAVWSVSTLFAILSAFFFFLMHDSIVKPHCSIFWISTVIFVSESNFIYIGLNFISLYKLQAETYNTHSDNNTEHLHNRDSEESQNDFSNPSYIYWASKVLHCSSNSNCYTFSNIYGIQK